MIKACVLTMSDKGSRGERTDTSGPALAEMLRRIGAETAFYEIIPDDRHLITKKLIEYSTKADLILTTGGTGLSPTDVTPEATVEAIEREVPGLAEAIRAAGLAKTQRAMLSRGMAGVRGRCLIINLPGSERGATESLEAVLDVLPHAVEKIKGSTADCGQVPHNS